MPLDLPHLLNLLARELPARLDLMGQVQNSNAARVHSMLHSKQAKVRLIFQHRQVHPEQQQQSANTRTTTQLGNQRPKLIICTKKWWANRKKVLSNLRLCNSHSADPQVYIQALLNLSDPSALMPRSRVQAFRRVEVRKVSRCPKRKMLLSTSLLLPTHQSTRSLANLEGRQAELSLLSLLPRLPLRHLLNQLILLLQLSDLPPEHCQRQQVHVFSLSPRRRRRSFSRKRKTSCRYLLLNLRHPSLLLMKKKQNVPLPVRRRKMRPLRTSTSSNRSQKTFSPRLLQFSPAILRRDMLLLHAQR